MREFPALPVAVIVVLAVFAVATFAPSLGVSGQAAFVAGSNSTSTPTPTATAPTTTATPTPAPTQTASSTPTPTPTATSTASSNDTDSTLAQSDVVTEQWDDNLQVLVLNESAIDHSRVQSIEVRGAQMSDELRTTEEDLVAQGTIETPTTVEVVVTYTDGTTETIYREQFD